MPQTKVQLIKDGALAEDSIVHDGDTNTKIRFSGADTITAETGGSERVRITSDGRVGIGTSPDSGVQLHVQKSGEVNMILEGDVNGQGGFFMLKNNSDNANTTMSIQNLDAGGQGTSDITFQNVSNANNEGFMMFKTRPSGGSMTERMRIDSSGNVGIGVTDIKAALQINSDRNAETDRHDGSNYHLFLRNPADDSGEACGLAFSVTSNATKTGGAIMFEREGGGSLGSMQFYTNSDGNSVTERMRIEANGRIRVPQVYSTAGSSMRDVQIESDGTLCGLSSITAAKTNITDVTDISWLYDLKPKTFNFRKKTSDLTTGVNTYLDEAETEKAYGLLAEDVEIVNKDFCFYDKDSEGNDVLAGVYYKTMVVPLIKAVQDLKAENTALTTRVAALEAA